VSRVPLSPRYTAAWVETQYSQSLTVVTYALSAVADKRVKMFKNINGLAITTLQTIDKGLFSRGQGITRQGLGV